MMLPLISIDTVITILGSVLAIGVFGNVIRREMQENAVKTEHRLTRIETEVKSIQRKVGAANRESDNDER